MSAHVGPALGGWGRAELAEQRAGAVAEGGLRDLRREQDRIGMLECVPPHPTVSGLLNEGEELLKGFTVLAERLDALCSRLESLPSGPVQANGKAAHPGGLIGTLLHYNVTARDLLNRAMRAAEYLEQRL